MENVFRFQVLDSTNTKAISIAKEGLSEAVVIAKRQTGGRGRMGRSFASPEGGLYLSYLTDRLAPGASVLALTPAAALAVRRAIFRTFGLSCAIKYPNDLILQDRKVCGILCESVAMEGRFCVVVGVGINVQTDICLDGMDQTSDYPPGALKDFCKKAEDPSSLTELESALIEELDALARHFTTGGSLDETEYRRHCINCPKTIIQY
ncbi:MAG: biotin--[Firmicutes bacterium]|nr:biotin--[acetyl-CoA-carboxylase] ligase [Bacillota bacterium]